MKRLICCMLSLLLLTSCGLPGRESESADSQAASSLDTAADTAADPSAGDAIDWTALFEELEAEAEAEAQDSAEAEDQAEVQTHAEGYREAENLIFFPQAKMPEDPLMYVDCTILESNVYNGISYVLASSWLGRMMFFADPRVSQELPPVSDEEIRVYFAFTGYYTPTDCPAGAFIDWTAVDDPGEGILDPDSVHMYYPLQDPEALIPSDSGMILTEQQPISLAWVNVYIQGGSNLYHVDRTCGGMTNPTVTYLTEAVHSHFIPCPECVPKYRDYFGLYDTNAVASSAMSSTVTSDGTWDTEEWTLGIDKVYETSDRNSNYGKTPGAVYMVEYWYTNKNYSDPTGILDGLYITIDDTVVDTAGIMGYSYPLSLSSYPQSTPVGATCRAQACIGVDNPGPFTVTISLFDSSGQKQSVRLRLSPS